MNHESLGTSDWRTDAHQTCMCVGSSMSTTMSTSPSGTLHALLTRFVLSLVAERRQQTLQDVAPEGVISNTRVAGFIAVLHVRSSSACFLMPHRLHCPREIHQIDNHLQHFVAAINVGIMSFSYAIQPRVVRLQQPTWPQPLLREKLHGQP